jgi:hypothetical protein
LPEDKKGVIKKKKEKKREGFGGHVDFGSGKKWDSRAESLHVAGAKRKSERKLSVTPSSLDRRRR